MINWFRPAPEWRCESILQKPQPLKSWCAALVMNWRFAFVCKAALNVRPSLRNWIWQSIGKQSKTKRIIFKICCVFMCFLIVLLCAFWPRGHLLFFASPKQSKQKKGDPGCRFGCAKLPSSPRILAAGANSLRSNIAHPFPAKIRSDSAAPGGRLHGLYVSGSLNKITCKWLRFNLYECITSVN